MRNLIPITIFVVTGILLLKNYKLIIEPKKRVLSYVILGVLASLFIFSLHFMKKFNSFFVPWRYTLISIIFVFALFIYQARRRGGEQIWPRPAGVNAG